MNSTNKRVVIITGATGTIGSKLAKGFGNDGWRVVVGYHKNKEKALELSEDIKKSSSADAVPWEVDLADIRSLERMINGVKEKWEKIDVLINNASISKDSLVLKMSLDDWDKVITVNLTGSFNLLKLASKEMMKKRDGHVINIASLLGMKGSVGSSNYAASKAAMISLGQSAAKELGRFNVRVNTVLPGFHKSAINEDMDEKAVENVKKDSLLNCTTDSGEMVEFVVFLSKTKSITGQIFNCDSRLI